MAKKRSKKRKRIDSFLSDAFGIIVVLFIVIMMIVTINSKKSVESVNQDVISQSDYAAEEKTTEATQEDKKTYMVCIDPGHGGYDPGSEGYGYMEKDQVLELALLVQNYLEEHNISVIMTRTEDVAVELKERANIANEAETLVMVSIHRNFYEGNEEVYGFEGWIHSNQPDEAVRLAQLLLDEIETVEGSYIRGIRSGTQKNERNDYAINKYSNMPSVILEMGFITNENDNYLLSHNMEAYAEAIGKGIIKYLEE